MTTIRHRVGIAASVEDVFAATHQPDHLDKWWACNAIPSARPDADIQLDFKGYDSHHWRITDRVENRSVTLTHVAGEPVWSGSTLRFDLEPAPQQIFVTLTHTTGPDCPPEAELFFTTKWPTFLVSLKAYLETGTGMPNPNDIKIQHD